MHESFQAIVTFFSIHCLGMPSTASFLVQICTTIRQLSIFAKRFWDVCDSLLLEWRRNMYKTPPSPQKGVCLHTKHQVHWYNSTVYYDMRVSCVMLCRMLCMVSAPAPRAMNIRKLTRTERWKQQLSPAVPNSNSLNEALRTIQCSHGKAEQNCLPLTLPNRIWLLSFPWWCLERVSSIWIL